MANGTSDFLVFLEDGVRTIKFNRPKRRNAVSFEVYQGITRVLNSDATDDNVIVTILTGVGEYFTSGNDISAALQAGTSLGYVVDFIKAFIEYPKLLIAIVNGPAIGIGVTILPLCDVVYASSKATFRTPFIELGLCPEAASSYTLNAILGRSKASEMLFLNHVLTAKEAYSFGLVAEIIEHDKLEEFYNSLKKYGKLSVNSVKITKKLIVDNFKSELIKVAQEEMKTLLGCLDSEEFGNAVAAFMSRKKSKL